MFIGPFVEQVYDRNRCFVCGKGIQDVPITDEHVIPKWAQRRFNLWNQELGLLNGTSIRYRSLTLCCCRPCNNRALQPLEAEISQSTLGGPDAVRQLGSLKIFLWLGKIFYGILRRESYLLVDREQPAKGTITRPALLDLLKALHLFLQTTFAHSDILEVPTSILVYKTAVPSKQELQWDFRDELLTLTMSIRMGSVGIVAALGDGGAQQRMLNELAKRLPDVIHPLQHLEIAALVAYRASLLKNTVTQFVVAPPNGKPVLLHVPVAQSGSRSLFSEWSDVSYSKYLSAYTGLPAHLAYDPARGPATFLQNLDGSARHMPLEEKYC
jgi:hypothetical protein